MKDERENRLGKMQTPKIVTSLSGLVMRHGKLRRTERQAGKDNAMLRGLPRGQMQEVGR